MILIYPKAIIKYFKKVYSLVKGTKKYNPRYIKTPNIVRIDHIKIFTLSIPFTNGNKFIT